ncbi:hypothetical protein NQ314_013581 [Rhamnusium bicolor]|uniref:Uncharacterized protein n=1 Tax=Rhamnusium bicolor TaxID=1586634 RepID=A0AAV8X561_9CUCU|nr:hypothetical protein NQ314_013581 [Rhamnusium bicolor]
MREANQENSKIIQELQDVTERSTESAVEKLQMREELQKIGSEKRELSDKLEETTQEKIKIIEDFKNVTEELDKTKCENQLLSQNMAQMATELKIIIFEKTELSEKLKTLEKLEQVSQDRNKEIQKLICENKDLSEKLDATLGENRELSETLKEELSEQLLKVMTDKNQVSEKLVEIINDKNNICVELKTTISEKAKVSDELEKIIEEKRVLSETLERALEEKAVVSKFLDLNNNELQKEKREIFEQLSQEKVSLLEALTRTSEEKIELARSSELCNKKLKEIFKEKIHFSEEIVKLTNEHNTVKLLLEATQKELENVCQEKANISEQFERVSQEKAEFSVQLDKVSQEKADICEKLQMVLKEKVADSESIKSELSKKISKISEENEQFAKQVFYISQEKDKISEALEATNRLLEVICQEKKDILEKMEQISKEKLEIKESLEFDKQELLKNLEEKSKTIQTLKLTITQLEKTIEEKSNSLEKLSQENKDIFEIVDKLNKELQKVKRARNEILESQTKIMKETENNILLAHENAVEVKNDLLKRMERSEREKQILKSQLESDLQKIREAYANVVSTNSKFELENVNLRKKIEDKHIQLKEYSQIKEAYEKLLEENNKLMTEVDTIKYKRSRDREEFVNILKKERDDADLREGKKIREVRNEYEGKLEKMKEKMLKLYREEVNKEMQKVKAGQGESTYLQKIIEDLRSELFEAEQKIHLLETERDMLRMKEARSQQTVYSSRESLRSLKGKDAECDSVHNSVTSLKSTGRDNRVTNSLNPNQLTRRVKSTTTIHPPVHKSINDRKICTLPRSNVTEVEETITISKRTSINGVPSSIGHNIEMEDEDDDLFNNKYLADLKDGRCTLPSTGRDSNVNRFSELAWRNSLVPPHLKSSYPAETQFAGNLELDDSMCRLLPGEKPRQRKDFGTTSYKKPGPPTPSKNGGRLSLQGNEIQPLREHNDKTPKKVTPSRIRALFMGRSSSTSLKENSENQCVTPRTKRLSIFRKQR